MPFTSTAPKLHPTWDHLQAVLDTWRASGERIVFTNGCFDILHLGHVTYLEAARALGHRLVLGLNTDASVRRLKGPSRPVNNEMARGRVLAALACTDLITFFQQDTPLELIQLVQPDVLVKGGDYTIENIVGHELVQARGGLVTTIPFVDGYSTTGTIEKLKC